MAVTKIYTANGQIAGQRVGGDFTRYMPDALGSVTTTSTNGSLATASYTPLGGGASPNNIPFGWVGAWGYRRTGGPSGLEHVRRRHLPLQESRWLSLDPIWPWQRAYAYVHGRLIQDIDPQGLYTLAFLFDAFISKWHNGADGPWFDEPWLGGSWYWQFKGDDRDPGISGTYRIASVLIADSCHVERAPAPNNVVGISTRRNKLTGEEQQGSPWVLVDYAESNPTSDCSSHVEARLSAAYPWAPPLGPTNLHIVADWYVYDGCTVCLSGTFRHSVFPDWEVLSLHPRELLYFYYTESPDWILAGGMGGMISKPFTYCYTGVPVKCQCQKQPCCWDECLCYPR